MNKHFETQTKNPNRPKPAPKLPRATDVYTEHPIWTNEYQQDQSTAQRAKMETPTVEVLAVEDDKQPNCGDNIPASPLHLQRITWTPPAQRARDNKATNNLNIMHTWNW